MSISTTQHIEIQNGVCGGKPCVKGTRIRVWDIHVWHDLRGQSPEEIVATYPQLTLADVYAALTYYFDHQEEIHQQAQEDAAMVAKADSQQPPSQFARLRDELLNKDSNADSVSSG